MTKICSFGGCENKHKGHGYCAPHLYQFRKNQDLRPIKKPILRTECIAKGCNNPHSAKGFCKKHYQQNKAPDNAVKRLELKKEVFSYYSKKLSNSDIPCCKCCGEHDFLIFLTIDHITNRKDTTHKKDLSGVDMYRYLQKEGYPSGYQVLCVNCNSAKSDFGECPHKRSIK